MRYAVIPRGLTLAEAEIKAKQAGGTNIRKTGTISQVFCELSEEQAARLSREPGLRVRKVKRLTPDQLVAQQQTITEPETVWDVFTLLRSYFSPALTGSGLSVAVLDSGMRSSHESFKTKVVYEANMTDSPHTSDVFGHGTQVAFCVAGGMHGDRMAGVSPGASLMNVKIIDDEGFATDEEVVMGIDNVCEKAQSARMSGLRPTDDLYPNVLNLSLGAEDDGDPDNPVRVACREAITDYGLDVVSAAGNYGPKMTTVTLPACDPDVIAVGAVETMGELLVWEHSSRGPTVEGNTKPDFVLWGVNLDMASNEADDEYVTKSGTSFSAPMLSGLTGLLWESGRRAYGEAWQFKWSQARELAPYFCTKPQDAAVKKGNTYGYGMPAMGTMLDEMGEAGAPPTGMEAMPSIIMMAFLARIAGGI